MKTEALPRVSESLRVRRDSGWSKLREEGHCRMCLRPASIRKLTRHHLVPQSYFNSRGGTGTQWRYLRDVDANLIGLCREDHDLIHDMGMSAMATAMLRKTLTQDEISFIVQVRGLDWFNLFYPKSASNREADLSRLYASLLREARTTKAA